MKTDLRQRRRKQYRIYLSLHFDNVGHIQFVLDFQLIGDYILYYFKQTFIKNEYSMK